MYKSQYVELDGQENNTKLIISSYVQLLVYFIFCSFDKVDK